MNAKKSAGILLYRFHESALEVFLIHPGGPYWAKKDAGVWSIPKGEFTDEESPQEAARREFLEETGCALADDLVPLTPLKQPSGKLVYAWAARGDCDEKTIKSNTFMIEWPPGSGKQKEFPEADRAGWFTLPAAREKILRGQRGFLDQLIKLIENI